MSLVMHKEYVDGANFWELNPQLLLIPPFSRLYDKDTTKDKSISSKQMWCVFFLREPDEQLNKFFRFEEREAIEMLEETYFPDADWWDSELFRECLLAYENYCLDAVARAFLIEKDSLKKRAILFRDTEYTLDTMASLDTARSKTLKIYEAYENLEKKFLQKKQGQRVKGGRKLSKSEQKLM
jgi:hypothetical protein